MSKTLAFVPVRGGSKSIPGKNIKNLCGKPLVYWVLKELSQSNSIDEIILATDSIEIKELVKQFNLDKVTFYDRNKENANDMASTESVMLEYIYYAKNLNDYDLFMLVQATSPFTKSLDFETAINQLMNSDSNSLLTCARIKRFFWNDDGAPLNYDYNHRPRRQDFHGNLVENGAFYINTVGNIKKFKNRLSGKIEIYEMPEFTSVEIDEEEDWLVAESLMRKFVLPQDSTYYDIKLFVSDVDGVLTDAGMYYTEFGDELKKFNTRDGMGFQLLRDHGIKTGIVTSESTGLVERRASKLKLDFLFQGRKHGGKLQAVKNICDELNINLSEVAYIGDDINCYELLTEVGLAACPNDAVDKIKGINGIMVLNSDGGKGVVREFAEYIIRTRTFYND